RCVVCHFMWVISHCCVLSVTMSCLRSSVRHVSKQSVIVVSKLVPRNGIPRLRLDVSSSYDCSQHMCTRSTSHVHHVAHYWQASRSRRTTATCSVPSARTRVVDSSLRLRACARHASSQSLASSSRCVVSDIIPSM